MAEATSLEKLESVFRNAMAALGTDLQQLPVSRLGELERMLASGLRVIRIEQHRRDGRRIAEWKRGGPGARGALDIPLRRGFRFDHPYALKHGNGRVQFISEPYDLDAHDLAELLKVAGDEWTLSLSGGMHLPGRSLQIIFERAAPKVEQLQSVATERIKKPRGCVARRPC